MYQARKKRRFSGLFVIFMLLFAVVIGIGAGYVSVKLNLLPDVINAVPEEKVAANTPLVPDQDEATVAPASLNTVVPAQPQDMIEVGYLVKVVDGDVCVFKIMPGGENVYSHKLPVVLEDLRLADRKKFEEGIRLGSKQELLEFIEDFSS